MQFAFHHGAHNPGAQALLDAGGGHAHAVVAHLHRENIAFAVRAHHNMPAVRQAVLHRIGDQFVEDNRQAGSGIGVHHPEFAAHLGRNTHIRGGNIGGHGDKRGENLGKVHDFVHGLGEDLVDEGNGFHAALRLGEHLDYLFIVRAARLHPQQRGYGLQIIFDAMVNFADRGVFADQLQFAPAQLANITRKHHRAHVLAILPQRHRPQGEYRPAQFEFRHPRGAPEQHHRQRIIQAGFRVNTRGDLLGEQLAFEGGTNPEAVQIRDRIRAIENHRAIGINMGEAIRDARGAVAKTARGALHREKPLGDHIKELLFNFLVGGMPQHRFFA